MPFTFSAGVPWPPLPAAGAVRRSRRYSLAGRLVSAQALLQRHPGLDVDAWPHLQQACARHDVSAFCLLLGLRTNPAHHGRHWNMELQATARQGPDGESTCGEQGPEQLTGSEMKASS